MYCSVGYSSSIVGFLPTEEHGRNGMESNSETDENLLKDMFAGGMENLQKDLVCNKLASETKFDRVCSRRSVMV